MRKKEDLDKLNEILNIDPYLGLDSIKNLNEFMYEFINSLDQSIKDCDFVVDPGLKIKILNEFINSKSPFVKINGNIFECKDFKVHNDTFKLNVIRSLCQLFGPIGIDFNNIRSMNIINIDSFSTKILEVVVKDENCLHF